MTEEGKKHIVLVDPPNEFQEIPTIIKISFSFFYFLSLVYLVFFARRRRHLKAPEVNFIPFQNIIKSTRLMTNAEVFNYYSNLIGNIVLFMPFPFILILVFRVYKSSTIIIAGLLLSFIIETLQYIFMVGVSDIDDILLNTAGTFAGLLCFRFFEKIQLL